MIVILFIMFKSIRKAIKAWYYKKLFLRIYFSHLNHPNQKNMDSAFSDAFYDLYRIKRMFKYKSKIQRHD